jgi:PEP-CTERM motif
MSIRCVDFVAAVLRRCFDRLRLHALVAVAALVLLTGWSHTIGGATLVDNPFVNSYSGWTDVFATRGGNWRLSLHHPTLMDTNNANPPTTGGGTNTGLYEPDVLVQNNFLAPANYELAARMRSNDDDLPGLVWNYQDPDNYFRVGLRQQPNSGNFGGTEGVSVQKVAGGVVTQLVGPGVASPITQAMIDNRTPFDVRVAVNGANYEIFFDGASVASGSDAALAAGRKVGIQSWAQLSDLAAVTPFWGTEIETFKVTQGAATLFNETFERRPVPWRQMVIRNSFGTSGQDAGVSKEVLGNFGMGIGNPWIHQDSNGFLNATFANADFIGPAVAVNEPDSANFTNYQMQVRMGAADNDAMGVLVRVQDDNNFYRIMFANENTGAAGTRAPRGMSVQKVRNGVWTELYRDDSNPLFVSDVAAPGTTPASPGFPMFDLTVGAVANALQIQVRNQAGTVIKYPIITDNTDPILAGTVGLHTWGTEDVYYMSHGGLDRPLLTSLSAFTDFDVLVDRVTGNITLTNNAAAPASIRGISIHSSSGGLIPANWLSIANNYDEPSSPTPGNGSIDPDDAWTITSSTAFSLSEREQSGGGGTLGVGQTVNFGNAWNRHLEDVVLQIELMSGAFVDAAVAYRGGTLWENSSGSGLWSDAVNWADDTEPTADSTVIFPAGLPGGESVVTLSAAETAAALILNDNYTLSAGSLTLPAGATISVAPGKTATITSALDAGTWTKSGDGTLGVPSVRADALTVGAGAVVIAAGGGTSVLGALSITGGATPTAKLDVNDNAVIINYTGPSPAATVRQQILAGRGGSGLGAAWNGQGISSSAAATAVATEPESRSVGFAENGTMPLGPYTTFRGQTVDDTSILMAFTRTGDANLDGLVNDDDVTIVGASYAPGVPQPHWALGDFDYNGFVDDDDVTLLGVFYDPSAPPLAVSPPAVTGQVSAVPEPTALLLFAIGAVVLALSLSRKRARAALQSAIIVN